MPTGRMRQLNGFAIIALFSLQLFNNKFPVTS